MSAPVPVRAATGAVHIGEGPTFAVLTINEARTLARDLATAADTAQRLAGEDAHFRRRYAEPPIELPAPKLGEYLPGQRVTFTLDGLQVTWTRKPWGWDGPGTPD